MGRRFFIKVAVCIAALSAAVLAYLVATMYYSSVSLRVIAACVANNNTQPGKSCDEQVAPPPFRIQDNDDLDRTPKLKEALLSAPLAHPNTSGKREYMVEMTPSEFDAMNRFLVNADSDAVRSYSSSPELLYKINPTSTLWSKSAMVVTVGHQGNAYELHTQYQGWLALTQY